MPPKRQSTIKELNVSLVQDLDYLTENHRRELANELYHYKPTKFTRRKVIVHNVNEIWSCDIMDLNDVSIYNKNIRFTLNIVDVFSKFAWVIPVHNKEAKTITKEFLKLFKEGKIPNKIWVDRGSEFINASMKKLLQEYNITLYSTYSESKSVVVERFNKTIKSILYKSFTENNSYKWLDTIATMVNDYNNRRHSTIKMSPIEALRPENLEKVRAVFTEDDSKLSLPAFTAGDFVRLSRTKDTFEKNHHLNFTLEVFNVHKVINTAPITYIISDGIGEIHEGSFYEQELLLANVFKKVFIVDKIIEHKMIDNIPYVLVSYKNFNDLYNRYIVDTDKI